MDAAAARWATFDVYGTLVNWRAGLGTYFHDTAGRIRGDEALALFLDREITARSVRPMAPYDVVLSRALAATFAGIGVPLPEGGMAAFHEAWLACPLYDDTLTAVRTLRDDGWRMALLTNCDRPWLGAAGDELAPYMAHVVTGGDAQSYKPDPGHLQQFARLIATSDGPTRSWVHVGSSYAHDIVPAFQLRIPTVWLDRLDEAPGRRVATVAIKTAAGLPQAVHTAVITTSRTSTV